MDIVTAKQESDLVTVLLKSVIGDNFLFINEIVKLQTLINPNSNRRIHLIGTKKSPVLVVLNFHSSEHGRLTIILF